MKINEPAIVGKQFTALDPNKEYVCIGYADNGTLLIIGADFDSVNNRTSLKTFKLVDVKFKGVIA